MMLVIYNFIWRNLYEPWRIAAVRVFLLELLGSCDKIGKTEVNMKLVYPSEKYLKSYREAFDDVTKIEEGLCVKE